MGKNCADRRRNAEWDSFIATQALYYANHNYEGGEIRGETKKALTDEECDSGRHQYAA